LLRATGLTALATLATLIFLPLLAQTAPAQAAPAQAGQGRSHSQGGVTLAIDSISPQTAKADSTVVVSGTVTNGTSAALAGLSVQLYSSDTQFTARETMDGYVDATSTPYLASEGAPFAFTGSIGAGSTATWHAEFTAAAAGMSGFGVYPVEAELASAADTVLGSERTLLPYWPASATAISKLKIAWIWPLIDQPHHQACPALTDNDLAASVGSGGRLGTLLAAGSAAPDADLTWAIDPALLSDVSTMTKPYQVGGSAANCSGAAAKPASTAAATWLKSLTASTASAPVIITPYANVDTAALVHQGLTSDLKSAYQLGEEVSGRVLNRSFSTDVALPAGGLADQAVLTALAANEHVSSVVLSSSEMPPAGDGFTPDDAVTSIHTMAGTAMNVLLADRTLTSLLAQIRPNMTKASQFALEQQFLAETAMIAAEAPDLARSVVVSPPETWGPSMSLASDLLRESTNAPWLQPTALGSLTGHQSRPAPAVSQHSSRELSAKYLAGALGPVETQLNVYRSMLYNAPVDYKRGLSAALAATQSSAWRGGKKSEQGGLTLVSGLKAYVRNAEDQVRIISSEEQVQMAGASGDLPVTIQNDLIPQNGLPGLAIEVTLNAGVTTAANVTSTLTLSRPKSVIIPAGQAHLVKLAIHSATQGPHSITLSLTSANGTVLAFAGTKLTVDSTRYGQAILILISGAIGLLLLTSAFRSSRRKHRANQQDTDAAGNVIPDPAGRPTGRSGEPKEAGAPDDLADARRGADDT
jgi:Family of unknown function (DUF6049)